MVSKTADPDVVLIGGGIMSATLGVLLKEVRPDWSIVLYERLGEVAQESSDPWSNAGTGHAALCELNYTPERPDGSIDISKGLLINEQFHQSRQFWSSLIERGELQSPKRFINPIPHMSYVKGDKDVSFLRRRFDALSREPLFAGLEYSEDPATIGEWAPLMMPGRDLSVPIAFTRHNGGTDVNFGELTRELVASLGRNGGRIATNHDVTGLEKQPDGRWRVYATDRATGERTTVTARFVFIGAGGRAIHLLQQSGIDEAKGYGGFPVSGQFIRTTNPRLVAGHQAKVYGKSQQKAPPMAMPHLDTRVIDGKQSLLFGPYAGFSPKFLKRGSIFDLLRSVRPDNLLTMLAVAKGEFSLTRYLIGQIMQSNDDRIATLRDFLPEAQADDWELIHAGMRVQTMKRTLKKRGVLEFGTEVVSARDGTIAGLLGASPGASTAVSIMIDVLQRCFPNEYPEWEPKLSALIPTIGRKLNDDPVLLSEIQAMTDRALQLRSTGQAVGAA